MSELKSQVRMRSPKREINKMKRRGLSMETWETSLILKEQGGEKSLVETETETSDFGEN